MSNNRHSIEKQIRNNTQIARTYKVGQEVRVTHKTNDEGQRVALVAKPKGEITYVFANGNLHVIGRGVNQVCAPCDVEVVV